MIYLTWGAETTESQTKDAFNFVADCKKSMFAFYVFVLWQAFEGDLFVLWTVYKQCQILLINKENW